MPDEVRIDPSWAWQRYVPSQRAPWDLRRVGHLYRRAAFGATTAQLQAGLRARPDELVAALLSGASGLDAFDGRMEPLAQTIRRSNNATNLSAWWLSRMLHSPHPLQEKMTLFWHNHFATSNFKVQSSRHMLTQYAMLRRHSLGSFATLLRETSTDPAMLIWLDGRGSTRGNPNENYAREVMELFSLGVGNYTEADVRQAARAFTGWDVRNNAAVFDRGRFDSGVKTVLGRRGNFRPDDVVRICLEQECCAYFVCGKLFKFLVSETIEPTRALLEPLATAYRRSDYDTAAVVRTILSSNLFFSDDAYRTKVKSPVEFALGVVRGLEGRIGTTALATSLSQLGQNLFHPPSVKGWDGGTTWLNGQTLLYRQNLALALCSAEDGRFGAGCDAAALARRHGKSAGGAELVDFLLELFVQRDVPAEARDRLLAYERSSHNARVPVYWTARDAADGRVRSLCHLVLAQPEFQLC
jgi:uncharacterized protein (DUF1800 family)